VLLDDTTLYARNLKELIHKFGKVAGYKANLQMSVELLHANNEHLKMK
jgi:hypothetical protein